MKLTKAFSADVTAKEGERAVTARITSAAVDREGEVLIPQGMNAKEFEKNPVVFLGHDYYTLPVGKVTNLKRSDSDWTAKVVFAERTANHPTGSEWVPDTLLSLFQQGVLKGFSVGFMVKESRPATDKDVTAFGPGVRRVISKWSLLELSVAPLPCNPDAVALAVSKGMLSPDTAKGVWGVSVKDGYLNVEADAKDAEQYKIPDACPEGACESRDPACEGCPNAKAAEPQPKRLTYFIEPNTPPQPDLASVAAKQAAAAIAKARGAIYYV
jgi:phage head maturation protease